MRRPRSHPVPVSAHVSSALKDLGVLPQRVTTAVESAWAQAADPAWNGQARPVRLQGGVLEVAVRSSSLREQLVQFHAERLLDVLKQALPKTPLVGLRFTPEDAR